MILNGSTQKLKRDVPSLNTSLGLKEFRHEILTKNALES